MLAEAAAAAVGAEDLMTAWTMGKTLLSMMVASQCQPDALSTGWAAAQALGGTDGATVQAEWIPAR